MCVRWCGESDLNVAARGESGVNDAADEEAYERMLCYRARGLACRVLSHALASCSTLFTAPAALSAAGH